MFLLFLFRFYTLYSMSSLLFFFVFSFRFMLHPSCAPLSIHSLFLSHFAFLFLLLTRSFVLLNGIFISFHSTYLLSLSWYSCSSFTPSPLFRILVSLFYSFNILLSHKLVPFSLSYSVSPSFLSRSSATSSFSHTMARLKISLPCLSLTI